MTAESQNQDHEPRAGAGVGTPENGADAPGEGRLRGRRGRRRGSQRRGGERSPRGRREGDGSRRGRRSGDGQPRGRREAPPTAPEPEGPVVLVAFRGGRIDGCTNPKELAVREGDHVLVEAERGMDLGRVSVCHAPAPKRRKNQPLRGLVRHATTEEIERLQTLFREDREALEICRGRAEHFKLDMKVIDAETQFDGNRVTFYFTAEHRVDFRDLVRDLASIFRTRIELRQVGARDAARRCDGIGLCGRPLCCTGFLREFEPVTLRMAKEQNLSLNPSKISGACGRLMCCLTYECAAYQEAVRQAPPRGSRWEYEGSQWVVRLLDIGNHRLYLEDADGERRPVDLDDFRAQAQPVVAEPAGEDGAADGS